MEFGLTPPFKLLLLFLFSDILALVWRRNRLMNGQNGKRDAEAGQPFIQEISSFNQCSEVDLNLRQVHSTLLRVTNELCSTKAPAWQIDSSTSDSILCTR